jgi:hypothetical protein
MSWNNDVGPIAVLGCRPGTPDGPDARSFPPGPHQHRRRPAARTRPWAAAAQIAGQLTRSPLASRRSYLRYWV